MITQCNNGVLIERKEVNSQIGAKKLNNYRN